MTTRHGSATVTLPSDTEILITRSFEAPRWLVWDALTTPRHLLRWWGPAWCPLVACHVDLQVGGDWRYVSLDDGGHELAWHGTYREIVVPERIVSTEVFEGYADAESVNVMTLTEHDGVTTLRSLVQHTSRENRDGHVNSGMEVGMQDTFDRLETLLDIADTPGERFRRIAGGFTDRVEQVPAGAWSNPAPCEGWTARDVVGHLVGWVPYVIGQAGIEFAPVSVDTDPAAAWASLVARLQTCLDDPDVACREFDAGPPGRLTVERAIDMLVTGDVLIHTWDLARAAGLDERLDAVFVHTMFEGMQPFDDILRASGHYGPKVAAPEGADEQTRLLAFTGRNPAGH
jgi:uncharacterized protein (TIGR03086 family)